MDESDETAARVEGSAGGLDIERAIRERYNLGPAAPLTEISSKYGFPLELVYSGVVRSLREILGVKLVAYLSGAGGTRTVNGWVNCVDFPSAEVMERLHLAHQVAQLIRDTETAEIAQVWFTGMNPGLDDRSPAELIRDSGLAVVRPEVIAAANAFISGG